MIPPDHELHSLHALVEKKTDWIQTKLSCVKLDYCKFVVMDCIHVSYNALCCRCSMVDILLIKLCKICTVNGMGFWGKDLFKMQQQMYGYYSKTQHCINMTALTVPCKYSIQSEFESMWHHILYVKSLGCPSVENLYWLHCSLLFWN